MIQSRVAIRIRPSGNIPYKRKVQEIQIKDEFRDIFHSWGKTRISKMFTGEVGIVEVPTQTPWDVPKIIVGHQKMPKRTPLPINPNS